MHFFTIFVSIIVLITSLNGSEKRRFYSQVNQDEFVVTLLYDLLGKQDSGVYLEIGAGDPMQINNTYVLEKTYGWQGISIDISSSLTSRWYSVRSNPLLVKDALALDYCAVLKELPQVIDYLSLDIDGYYDVVLRKVMDSSHIFKIITIEHDYYRYGDIYRNKEREILTAFGYHLLYSDIPDAGDVFEDWWIHPDYFPSFLLQKLTSQHLQGKTSDEIIHYIKTMIPK